MHTRVCAHIHTPCRGNMAVFVLWSHSHSRNFSSFSFNKYKFILPLFGHVSFFSDIRQGVREHWLQVALAVAKLPGWWPRVKPTKSQGKFCRTHSHPPPIAFFLLNNGCLSVSSLCNSQRCIFKNMGQFLYKCYSSVRFLISESYQY